MRSPANLNSDYSGHSVPDLNIVSQRLMAVKDDRDPKRFVDLVPPLTESPETPPYPNPLDPVEYWRVWSQVKAQQLHLMDRFSDHRSLIADFEYWRTEAEFLASRAIHSEKRRLQIRDVDYWRIESLYWFNAWMRKDIIAQRRDIDDVIYWRCEATFWTQTVAFTREAIVDAKYWQTETNHYNLQLDNTVDATSPSQLTTSSIVNITSTAPSSRPTTRAPSSVEAMQPLNQSTQQRRSSRLRARTQRAINAKLNEDKSLSKRRKRRVR